MQYHFLDAELRLNALVFAVGGLFIGALLTLFVTAVRLMLRFYFPSSYCILCFIILSLISFSNFLSSSCFKHSMAIGRGIMAFWS